MKRLMILVVAGGCATPTQPTTPPELPAPTSITSSEPRVEAAPKTPTRDARADATKISNFGIDALHDGRTDEALALFRKAIETDATFAEAHGNLGAALARLRRFDEATTAFEHAVKLDSKSATLWLSLGRAALSDRQSAKAYKALTQATELGDSSARTLDALGRAARALDKHEEAAKAWTRAATLDPTAGSSAVRLAQLYDRWGYVDQALTVAKFGAQGATGAVQAELLYLVGLFSGSAGNHKQAIAAFNAVLALVPKHYWALAQRGQAFAALSDFGSARADFEAYLSTGQGDTFTTAVVAQRLLQILRQRSKTVEIPSAPTLDALALPPVPEFESFEVLDGVHSVGSLRAGRESLFGKTVMVRGTISWIYNCEAAQRRPGV